MAANTAPIYCRTPDVQQPANNGETSNVIGPSANTAQDGTGANVYVVFQADAIEGGFVDEITLKPVGAPAATVIRIFLYTGSSGTFTKNTSNTVANMTLIRELSLQAITSSNTAAQNDMAIPIRKQLAAGQRLIATFGTSTGASGVGYALTTWAGKY